MHTKKVISVRPMTKLVCVIDSKRNMPRVLKPQKRAKQTMNKRRGCASFHVLVKLLKSPFSTGDLPYRENIILIADWIESVYSGSMLHLEYHENFTK